MAGFYYSDPFSEFPFTIPRLALGSSGEFKVEFGFTLEEVAKIVWRTSELSLNASCSAASESGGSSASASISAETVIRRKVRGTVGSNGSPDTPTPDPLTEADLPLAGKLIAWQNYESDFQRNGDYSTEAGVPTYTSGADAQAWVVIDGWRFNTDTDLFYPILDFGLRAISFSGIWWGDGAGGGAEVESVGAGVEIVGPRFSGPFTTPNGEAVVFGKTYPTIQTDASYEWENWPGGRAIATRGDFEASAASYFGWDPGDDAGYPGKVGAGPVYNPTTGEEERDPKCIAMRGDGTFYNPYHTEEEE